MSQKEGIVLMKRKILIINGRYLPGYKDGGPVRSIKNLTDLLGDEYDFKILTCDRDHGDTEPYPNIKVNDWNRVGNADVYYVAPGGFKAQVIKKLAESVDLIYLCGCFSDYSIKTLILNRMGQIKKPVVVAAMGLFSPMEFRLKYKKKKLFTTVFNVTGMFKNIYWSATSELEISEIKQQVKARDDQFYVAEDLPRVVDPTLIHKVKDDTLEVVWISRIAPKKNLKGAIQILQQVRGKVHFTIYGQVHVEEYWRECQEELEKLPTNVTWEYKGNADSEQVVETLKPYHVFLFPTLGENYGHVIQEALSAGCACILSDQTPWKNLEKNGVGYVFPVEETNAFANVVEKYTEMSEEKINAVAARALRYAIRNSNEKVNSTGYRNIFDILR